MFRTMSMLALAALLANPVAAEERPLQLKEVQRLGTSGARAVEPFRMGEDVYVAIPQLAEDIPSQPANMDGGDSDVATVVFRWESGKLVEFQRIPSHGSEDAEFFTIGDRMFLAICGVRMGRGPYNPNTYAMVYEFDGRHFFPVQQLATFAAKQVRAFTIGAEHYLAIANGLTLDGVDGDPRSRVYRWDGTRFREVQTLPSRWAYDLEYFEIDGKSYLGLADHLDGWTLYEWKDGAFQSIQTVSEPGARDLTHFRIDGTDYLAYANLVGTSRIYRFSDGRFVEHQALEGPGGRAFHFLPADPYPYLVRVNFITGDRTKPQAALQSTLFRWNGMAFEPVQSFSTFGGTGASSFEAGGERYLVVSNSLAPDLRFRVDSVVYRLAR